MSACPRSQPSQPSVPSRDWFALSPVALFRASCSPVLQNGPDEAAAAPLRPGRCTAACAIATVTALLLFSLHGTRPPFRCCTHGVPCRGRRGRCVQKHHGPGGPALRWGVRYARLRLVLCLANAYSASAVTQHPPLSVKVGRRAPTQPPRNARHASGTTRQQQSRLTRAALSWSAVLQQTPL
jgi:hypothetical protein